MNNTMTKITDGAQVKLINTGDTTFDGVLGRVDGIHKAGTYSALPDEEVFMIWVGDTLLGEFGEEELEVIG